MHAIIQFIDPKWFDLGVGLLLFLVTYAIRRFAPNFWVTVTTKNPSFQTLWLAVVGALIGGGPAAATGHGMWQIIQQTILGAVLVAVIPQGLHASLKALPVPYRGAEKQVGAIEAARASAPVIPVEPR